MVLTKSKGPKVQSGESHVPFLLFISRLGEESEGGLTQPAGDLCARDGRRRPMRSPDLLRSCFMRRFLCRHSVSLEDAAAFKSDPE